MPLMQRNLLAIRHEETFHHQPPTRSNSRSRHNSRRRTKSDQEEEKLQKECLKEGRSRAIGRLRACFVAHHRLLGHQEENVEIEHVRQFWEAEQRSHEKHFWKTKL